MLSRVIGIGGLALATSAAAIVTVVLMWHQCEKLSEHAKIVLQWKEIGKIVLTSILMGAIVVFVKQSVHVTGLLQLFFLVFVGMASYGVMLLIFRVEMWKLQMNCFIKLRQESG